MHPSSAWNTAMEEIFAKYSTNQSIAVVFLKRMFWTSYVIFPMLWYTFIQSR
jgi:hypothetical protein